MYTNFNFFTYKKKIVLNIAATNVNNVFNCMRKVLFLLMYVGRYVVYLNPLRWNKTLIR